MVRRLLARSVVVVVLALGLTGLLLRHSACVAHERPLTRISGEGSITPGLAPGLPGVDEIEASESTARPALTR